MGYLSKCTFTGAIIFAFSTPQISNAASTDPLLTLGLSGSYNEYRLDGQGIDEDDKSYLGEGGVFAEFGNKISGGPGWVYQASLNAKYGEKNDSKTKEGQADFDLGYRLELDPINYLDAIVGGGYSWNRYEPQADDLGLKLTNKTPFVKAALGYNHRFDNSVLRVEVGARHTLDGRAKLKADNLGSDSIDLKDGTNPYAEISMLVNQKGTLPIMAGIYYTHTQYKLDSDFEFAENTKLKRDEYGLKLGVAF
ncbi:MULTISPECIES: hypothetical protein [Pseudomonas]|uniref:Outer membrane protein beta-barrel domain-containing protein n=1 Tax=Pseudomonas luteola TaxID=47886 RepID=A0A2X2BYI4_PSELU|nr:MULTISPECIES: hypothetical protein [Pseudomonas]MCG7373987.1 hypothetical protein [Pseudomonas luteola]RRW39876.1 hypothetical protein EGJ50_25310 [Pseudomonas luteola]SHJ43676.1 hypothetical protein SAMN05216295_113148 [Pseudomonas zeshuii]SPZ00164.1 Uncharacterised protein [Pseudomonas luteola]